MFSAAEALLLGEASVRINLVYEPLEEALSGMISEAAGVVPRVQHRGPEPRS